MPVPPSTATGLEPRLGTTTFVPPLCAKRIPRFSTHRLSTGKTRTAGRSIAAGCYLVF
uniref:Uncharacterized protein n=2 Tax=Oryza rufipogon TaxID=4529 RepID=A0A0E0R7G0_ORYRU